MNCLRELETFTEALTQIIGKPGPITIDTQIISHNFVEESWAKQNGVDEVFVVGEQGKEVTLEDVLRFFCALREDERLQEVLENGRTYFFEGVEMVGEKKLMFCWGS